MYSDGTPDVLIRLNEQGHTKFRDEKVVNEVRVIEFLQENTDPNSALDRLGLTKDCPQHFGPFKLPEFLERVRLSDVLRCY